MHRLLTLTLGLMAGPAAAQTASSPDTVIIRSDGARLRALIWRPDGPGPFPAIFFNHGSGRNPAELRHLGPYEAQAAVLGPLFARHGYLFFHLYRRGVGLSGDQGTSAINLLDSAQAAGGWPSRFEIQMELLQGREIRDARAGLAFLRALPDVDVRRIGMVGWSLGSSLTMLMAEHDSGLCAIVAFSPAGFSWLNSGPLRAALLQAAHDLPPVLFIHAENDYTVEPGRALDTEVGRVGHAHQLRIYPPVGSTAADGHRFIDLGLTTWEADVFGFLAAFMGQR